VTGDWYRAERPNKCTGGKTSSIACNCLGSNFITPIFRTSHRSPVF